MSIKTSKFNANFLDVASSQYENSDVFVDVKVGLSRFHFTAFLKEISFLRTKLFPEAQRLGELKESDAKQLLEETPDFAPIPAYIVGFVTKPMSNNAKFQVTKTGDTIKVESGLGIVSFETIRRRSNPPVRTFKEIDIGFRKLGEDEERFVATTGKLAHERTDWKDLIREL